MAFGELPLWTRATASNVSNKLIHSHSSLHSLINRLRADTTDGVPIPTSEADALRKNIRESEEEAANLEHVLAQ